MDNYQDIFKTLCRICLRPSKHRMVSLFDHANEGEFSCYGKAVITFADIVINAHNELPSQMCHRCLFLLKNAIKFKLECEKNDRHIKKLIANEDIASDTFKENFIQYLFFLHHFPNDMSYSEYERIANDNMTVATSLHIPDDDAKRIDDAADQVNNAVEGSKDEFKEALFDDNNDEIDVTNVNSDDDVDDTSNVDDFEYTDDEENNNGDVDDGDAGDGRQWDKDPDAVLNIMEKMLGESRVYNNRCHKSVTRFQRDLQAISMIDRNKKQVQEQTMKRVMRKLAVTKARRKTSDNEDHSCNTCGKRLANKHSLFYHQQRHGAYQMICEVCGKGYVSKGELESHQANHHGVGNVLTCQYCSFRTPRKLDLVEHERIHTGERPYTCDKCGLSFRRKYLYTRHIVHHAEKTVQCPQCPRRFYHRSHMRDHSNNVHERRYVYTCVRCGCVYARSATLRRHLLQKHGVKREDQVLHKVYADPKLPMCGLSRRRPIND